MMNKYILILIVLLLNLNNTQSAFATEVDPLAALKKEYLKQNSVDAQIAAYDDLYALPENEIASRTDVFSKRILGYIGIAAEGIRYVQHHYRDNSVVLGSCESLHAELMEKAAEGLTPLEFILFNMKLALIQEHYPHGYPLDFDQDTQIVLKDGRFKTTPFYEFDMPAVSAPGSFDSHGQPDLISQFKSSFSNLFEEEYKDCAFKPYIIYNPNGGFKTSRITKNILRTDGKHRTLCGLPIGTVSVENSPHGIYNRTPFAFLMHDLGHSNSVWYKLATTPGFGALINVQNFIHFIQPIVEGINEHRISDTIIDNFLFLMFYEDMYTQPIWHADSSSLKSIFTSIENKYDPEKSKEVIIDYTSGRDPFIDIINTYGRDHGYYFLRDYSKGGPQIRSTAPDHYTGTRNIQLNGKTASFTCTAKRTGEISETSPWHEYAEIMDIDLISGEPDEKDLEAEFIEEILNLKGKRYVVPTLEGLASSGLGVRKGMLQALGKSTHTESFNELALELLEAFKAKVTEHMPEALI